MPPKGKHYNQPTLDGRYHIQAFTEIGFSARQIAIELGVSNKTISRELKRCEEGAYKALVAEQEAIEKSQSESKYTKQSTTLRFNIRRLLKAGLSPEQIAGRSALETGHSIVSLQTLYRWIRAWGWRHLLVRQGRPYRPKHCENAGVRCISDRVDISERPSIVEENAELGLWEGDTVYGQDSYFVTLTERISKLFLV